MRQEIFVGREDVLSKTKLFLQEIEGSKSLEIGVLAVYGVGGIGKTKLVSRIRDQAIGLGFASTTVIDLKITSNRSTISLLDTIIQSVYANIKPEHRVILTPFFDVFVEYNRAHNQEKYLLFEKLVEQFQDSLQILSEVCPVLVVLDTFETVQKIKIGEWLIRTISKLSGRVCVLIAGRENVQVPKIKQLTFPLEGLSSPEIMELSRRMFASRGIEDDFDLSISIIDSLAYLTEGRPILITLAIEWILEDVEPEKIVNIPRDKFEEEIVLHIKDLAGKDVFFKELPSFDERRTIIMMSTLFKRFDEKMLSVISGWSDDVCKEILLGLQRFFFVKTFEGSTGITLHDEMIRLVNTYVDYPLQIKNSWRKLVSEKYYPSIIKDAVSVQSRQAFIAEKIFYHLQYEPELAINEFDEVIQQALSVYDLEFVDFLLAEASSVSDLSRKCINIIRLNRAELLQKRYQPFEAKNEFDALIKQFDPETETKYLSRAIDGLGACIANGATVVEANINEAIELWKKSLVICEKKGLSDRVVIIYYQLGSGYDLLGQHEEAIQNYALSNQLARRLGEWQLVTKTLDEMGRLRRKRYEVTLAMELFQESLKIKESHNDIKSMGVSYHYIGDAYRDLDNFEEALKWYHLAESARQEVSDEYGLCVLYGDIGWLYLLDKNWEKATEYTDKSYYEYAVPRHFGREMAEMEHSYYHIELEKTGLKAALPWIEKAFKNADIYSNTFIYLDAALHLIEAAYSLGQYEKIPFYYEKMDELDRKGCGYKMFKGRATNILGDIEYEKKNFGNALRYWKEGYAIIAVYGRSRSSVKNFNDHLSERIEKISFALLECEDSAVEEFYSHWINSKLDDGSTKSLSDEYPGFLGLIQMAQGDRFEKNNQYELSVERWAEGLSNWVFHMLVKDKTKVLNLDHILSSREDNIKKVSKQTGIKLELANKVITGLDITLRNEFDALQEVVNFRLQIAI